MQYAPNQTFPHNMNKANATSFLIPVETLGEEVGPLGRSGRDCTLGGKIASIEWPRIAMTLFLQLGLCMGL